MPLILLKFVEISNMLKFILSNILLLSEDNKFSKAEKDYGSMIARSFEFMIKDLESKGKINPQHIKEHRDKKRMFNFTNQSALHINFLDGIVRIPKERKDFLAKNKDIESDFLDEIWFDSLVVMTLRNYWSIEMSLITLLKGVQYGSKQSSIVVGKENLGYLRDHILNPLGYSKHIDWDSIDVDFRNQLAHGWFYRKKTNFVFFNNAKLKKGKNLTEKQLLYKCRLVQLNALVISALVGNWKELTDFGSKDPMKKSKRK